MIALRLRQLRYSVGSNISKNLLSPEKTSCRKEQVRFVMSFNSWWVCKCVCVCVCVWSSLHWKKNTAVVCAGGRLGFAMSPLEGRTAPAAWRKDCSLGWTDWLFGSGSWWPLEWHSCGWLHRVRALWGGRGGRRGDTGTEGGGLAWEHGCDSGGNSYRLLSK